jgi:hypothetical protein
VQTRFCGCFWAFLFLPSYRFSLLTLFCFSYYNKILPSLHHKFLCTTYSSVVPYRGTLTDWLSDISALM